MEVRKRASSEREASVSVVSHKQESLKGRGKNKSYQKRVLPPSMGIGGSQTRLSQAQSPHGAHIYHDYHATLKGVTGGMQILYRPTAQCCCIKCFWFGECLGDISQPPPTPSSTTILFFLTKKPP